MKLDMTTDEYLHLVGKAAQVQMEYERLKEQVVRQQTQIHRLSEEVEYYKAMVAVVTRLQEQWACQGTAEKMIPLSLENLHALVNRLSNAEVSQLVFSLIRLLPEGAPAEMVKMIADAAPADCLSKEGLNLNIANAGDVVTGGGMKNVSNYTGQEPTNGGTHR